jgi:hypothetical protein
MAERKVKISVVLPLSDFERYEGYCEEKGFKKSTLIARLVRDHLDAAGYYLQRELAIPAHQVKGLKRQSNPGGTKE